MPLVTREGLVLARADWGLMALGMGDNRAGVVGRGGENSCPCWAAASAMSVVKNMVGATIVDRPPTAVTLFSSCRYQWDCHDFKVSSHRAAEGVKFGRGRDGV